MSLENASETPSGALAWVKSHALALAASLLVGGGFAWLLSAGALPVVPPEAAWSHVRHWAVVAYAGLFVFVHALRCSRWGLLLSRGQRPSLGLCMGIGMLGYGSLVILPFRLGEAARPALLHTRAHLPIGTSAGVMGAERIVDGLVLSVILLVALLGAELVSPLPDHIGELPIPASIIPGVAWGGVIVFGVLSLAMVAFYVWQEPVRHIIHRLVGRFSPALAARAAQAVVSVARGFRFLNDRETAPPFALATAAYWALNVGGLWLLAWGTGLPSPSLAQATVILGVLGLGLVVPNAPGFFGTFQISAYSAMVLFYPLEAVTSAGAAFVFLLYVVQMGVILGGAGVALAWEYRRARRERAARAAIQPT